ncbi:TetR/AcrR family transcriptional regulator [Cellulomonas sp. S1-8]|uniref:TetR/AcrR family transcriptional regulator n=1 Tax=Cellulomonas sp. S1-8 TaxID=2904790 RepID=UPI0022438F6A|nr:TetR/AcrR family transcriptional regulator [Cellulomonas sp. S1-8]UZN03256.1 TetR/AcrR family transcriptional regulator [Cellulomonas sp. S1-8]
MADDEGRRARLRRETVTSIKAAAWTQVRELGAAALSLRAVARSVGLSSPGLYRYYASRDDLLTDLVADAYDDLARALEQARDQAGAALRDRLRAAMVAYRDWAVDHPAEWSLIFGTPVPAYTAPVEGRTTAAARRFGAVLLTLLHEATSPAGDVPAPGTTPDPPDFPDDLYRQAARLWARLHGVLALGLHGHFFPAVRSPEQVRALYLAEVDDALRDLLGPGR